MKVLVLRFSSIGDIVLTSPVVRCLKKQLPDTVIHFLTKKTFASVVENNPFIDKVFLFQENTDEIIEELKANKYDLIIDLHNNLRSIRLKRQLGVRSSTFHKLNLKKWLVVNFKINLLPPIHIVDRYLKTVESLGVKNDGEGLDYFITTENEKVLSSLGTDYQNYIAWVIGAKHATKQLPVEKMISIGKKISSPIILLGGKEDVDLAAKIVQALPEKKTLNLSGKISLNESAAIIKHASKVITHDTGLMHIAAAFKKEIISLWGNTVPEFGMYPYMANDKSVMLEVKGLSCRPCSKIGFEKCPRGHFKCMRDQAESVFENL